MSPTAASLRAQGLRKRYPAHARATSEAAALDGVDLELPARTHACVMGASGSGKTTLLRALAGLEALDAGALWIGDARIDGLPPEQRPTRSVFQTPALFPHLSVLDNLTFVDRLRAASTLPPASLPATALLEALGLDPGRFAGRSIDALSGGERQRVALARALYRAPPWLLFDEPLSALDLPRRAQLRRALARLCDELELGLVHVTHAAADALALADQLIVLDAGKVIAHGPPARLYRRPPNLTSARLLGELTPAPDGRPGAYLRPEHLALVAPGEGRAQARLLTQTCSGPSWILELAPAGGGALPGPVLASSPRPWEGSSSCGLRWDDDDILVLE